MTLFRRYTLPLLFAALTLTAGCAGAPLQEMSDARQAIGAAQRAGAEKHAPALLSEAQKLVESARIHLTKSEYREARDEAERARDKASEARRIAEYVTKSTGAP
jgi:hypothetical protein